MDKIENKMQLSKLTMKQEAFVFEYIRNGREGSEAYKKIYKGKANSNTIYKNVYTLLQNTKIITRIKEIQNIQYDIEVMDITERKIKLSLLARGGNLKAMDMLNKMDGVYIKKHVIEDNLQIQRDITRVLSADELIEEFKKRNLPC